MCAGRAEEGAFFRNETGRSFGRFVKHEGGDVLEILFRRNLVRILFTAIAAGEESQVEGEAIGMIALAGESRSAALCLIRRIINLADCLSIDELKRHSLHCGG